MNPLDQKGMPLEDQLRSWSELNVEPYDKLDVHPYTRTRVILMNGIEVESILFSHQFARNTDNLEIKQALALSRRVDAQQQKVVNGLNPGDQTPLETTIGYEQVAVDLTSWLARHEPDPMLKQALDFALLEDFDHLYRYANLYELLDGKDASPLPSTSPRSRPGRPTVVEHRHPHDDVRGHFDDPHRRSAVAPARHDDRRRRAADDELLHEPRQRLDRADRPWPLRRDRAHRGAARDALRVAARPARLVAQAARVPRVQRGLPVLVDAPERGRQADRRDLGTAPRHGDRPAARRVRPAAPLRGRRTRGDPAAGAARHAGHVRAEQGLRARDPRYPGRPARRRPRLRAGRRTCPRTTVHAGTATS